MIKNHTAKSFEPKYKGNYRIVKIHDNNMEIQDYRGSISMVHITDVNRTTLKEQIAIEYEQGKSGRFSKKCIPKGYIPDLDWTTIHKDSDQPKRIPPRLLLESSSFTVIECKTLYGLRVSLTTFPNAMRMQQLQLRNNNPKQ